MPATDLEEIMTKTGAGDTNEVLLEELGGVENRTQWLEEKGEQG